MAIRDAVYRTLAGTTVRDAAPTMLPDLPSGTRRPTDQEIAAAWAKGGQGTGGTLFEFVPQAGVDYGSVPGLMTPSQAVDAASGGGGNPFPPPPTPPAPGGLEYDPRYKTTPFPGMFELPRVPGQQGSSPWVGSMNDPLASRRDPNKPPGPVGRGPGLWTYDGWGGFWRGPGEWVRMPDGSYFIKGETSPKWPNMVAGVDIGTLVG